MKGRCSSNKPMGRRDPALRATRPARRRCHRPSTADPGRLTAQKPTSRDGAPNERGHHTSCRPGHPRLRQRTGPGSGAATAPLRRRPPDPGRTRGTGGRRPRGADQGPAACPDRRPARRPARRGGTARAAGHGAGPVAAVPAPVPLPSRGRRLLAAVPPWDWRRVAVAAAAGRHPELGVDPDHRRGGHRRCPQMSTGGGPVPARPPAAKAWHGVHKALADPLRIRLVEWLMERPRSARELADCASLPADRLYYHLGQLEQAGLIEVAEYRRLARGKAERVYAPAKAEPPGDDASPQETAAFLGSVLEATAMDITAAFQAKQAGRRREVDVTRAALRLTDEALAELRSHLAQIAARSAEPETEGTWTRLVLVLADLQDRPGPAPRPASPA